MLTGPEWTGLGVAIGIAVSLLGVYVANRVGLLQVGTMRDAHNLNVRKATPRINSRVDVRPFHPSNRTDVTRYAIHTKIYNDGDLVARYLEGEWQLTASQGIQSITDVIRENSPPSTSPLEFKHEIVGNFADLVPQANPILQVDIKLDYVGLDDKPEHYEATYDYNFEHKRMILRKAVIN
jgi:hypothetical protein